MELSDEVGRKLGPELKRCLLEVVSLEPRLDMLLQADRELDDAIVADFDRLGVVPRTVAGDVMTLSVDSGNVLDLASCDWVVRIELSRPMSFEATVPPVET